MLALKFTDLIAARLLPPMISSKSGLPEPISLRATGDDDVMQPPADGMKALLDTICTMSALPLARKAFGAAMVTFDSVGDEDAARSIAFIDKRASSL